MRTIQVNRFVQLDKSHVTDITTDDIPTPELTERLRQWCKRSLRTRASLKTCATVGFVLALLDPEPEIISTGELSRAQLDAVQDGTDAGRIERRRRQQLAGVDTAYEDIHEERREAWRQARYEAIFKHVPLPDEDPDDD